MPREQRQRPGRVTGAPQRADEKLKATVTRPADSGRPWRPESAATMRDQARHDKADIVERMRERVWGTG